MKLTFRAVAEIFILGLLSISFAARAGAPKTQMVQFPSGKETVDAFLATPDAAGRHPAIVVVHEWWGLNDWVKEQTEKLAGQGYVALAVDLYRGKTATTPEDAHELMRGLPQDRGVRDLMAAYDYLGTRQDVTRDRIGSIGWCMGGGFSIQLAIHQPRLAACVVNYGALPTDPNDIGQIYAPVLGNFGAEDHGITAADVQAFEKSMKTMSKRIDVKVYDGAGHGFQNPNNKNGYRPDATADAWARTINFFNKNLK
ncbi:MAG: dienelactone hydrolase family protein [Candidatus Acidiferrales bacterium]